MKNIFKYYFNIKNQQSSRFRTSLLLAKINPLLRSSLPSLKKSIIDCHRALALFFKWALKRFPVHLLRYIKKVVNHLPKLPAGRKLQRFSAPCPSEVPIYRDEGGLISAFFSDKQSPKPSVVIRLIGSSVIRLIGHYVNRLIGSSVNRSLRPSVNRSLYIRIYNSISEQLILLSKIFTRYLNLFPYPGLRNNKSPSNLQYKKVVNRLGKPEINSFRPQITALFHSFSDKYLFSWRQSCYRKITKVLPKKSSPLYPNVLITLNTHGNNPSRLKLFRNNLSGYFTSKRFRRTFAYAALFSIFLELISPLVLNSRIPTLQTSAKFTEGRETFLFETKDSENFNARFGDKNDLKTSRLRLESKDGALEMRLLGGKQRLLNFKVKTVAPPSSVSPDDDEAPSLPVTPPPSPTPAPAFLSPLPDKEPSVSPSPALNNPDASGIFPSENPPSALSPAVSPSFDVNPTQTVLPTPTPTFANPKPEARKNRWELVFPKAFAVDLSITPPAANPPSPVSTYSDYEKILQDAASQSASISRETGSLTTRFNKLKESFSNFSGGTKLALDGEEEVIKTENVLIGVDSLFKSEKEKVTNSLVIKDKTGAYAEYAFFVEDTNIILGRHKDNSFLIADKNGDGNLFEISNLIAADKTGASTKNLTLTQKSPSLLSLSIDPLWLGSPERVYPIVIEKTISPVKDENKEESVLLAPKSSYSFLESPSFSLVIPKSKGLFSLPDLHVKGDLENRAEITKVNDHLFQVLLPPSSQTVSGKKTLTVIMGNNQSNPFVSQDFTWGVLALNSDKSIYLPGETANLAMAVLNEQGRMVCDAKVVLNILDPAGKETLLSSEDGSIIVSPECSVYGITSLPDYYSIYQTTTEGVYSLTLTAQTKNGIYSISDAFEVQKDPPLDVKRIMHTRIYPSNAYPVEIEVNARRDFKGDIIETLPSSFSISNLSLEVNGQRQDNSLPLPAGLTADQNNVIASEAKLSVSEIPKGVQSPQGNLITEQSNKETMLALTKEGNQPNNPQSSILNTQIVFPVDIKTGDKIILRYQYKTPTDSPAFYLAGPLKFSSSSPSPDRRGQGEVEKENEVTQLAQLDQLDQSANTLIRNAPIFFEENRQWQIAIDANARIRQEYNLVDTTVGAGTFADGSKGMALLPAGPDTTNGTLTWYAEIIAANTNNSGSVVIRYNAGSGPSPEGGMDVAFNIIGTDYKRYRSPALSPAPSGSQLAYLYSVSPDTAVKAARLILIQEGGWAIQKTQTQIEIGNYETGKTNTNDAPLNSPKYWYYDSGKWSDLAGVSAEVTYKNNASSSPVTVKIQQDDGNFNNWTDTAVIVDQGTATKASLIRSAPFTPVSGRNYRLVSSASEGASYDLFNAKIIVSQSSASYLTKLESQYQLANTRLAGGTSLQDYDTWYDESEWQQANNTYVHEAGSQNQGASAAKLQSDPNGAPADVAGSLITDINQRKQSSALAMPPSPAVIDVLAPANHDDLYNSKIIAQVSLVVPTISLSGTSNLRTDDPVRVAVNSTLLDQTGVISPVDGNWSITDIPKPNQNDILTVFIETADSADKSTAVAKYHPPDTELTGFILDKNVLSLGYTGLTQTLAVNDLGFYDYGSNNQLLHYVGGQPVLDLTKTGLASLNILAGTTFTQNTSETLLTHDLFNAGTIFAGASAALVISGSYQNSGTYLRSTETVSFTSTTTETLNTGGLENPLYNVVFNGESGEWTLDGNDLAVNRLSVASGTIRGGRSIDAQNGFDCTDTCGSVLLTDGTVTVSGGNFGSANPDLDWTFYNLTFSGEVSAAGAGRITTTNVLTVSENAVLAAGAKTYSLTGAQEPFLKLGTFNPDASTISYDSASGASPASGRYYNLRFRPLSGSPVFLLKPEAYLIENDLTIEEDAPAEIDAGSVVVLDIDGSFSLGQNTSFTAPGSGSTFSVAKNFTALGLFLPNKGTVTFDSENVSTVKPGFANSFYDLISVAPPEGKIIRLDIENPTTITHALTLTGNPETGIPLELHSTVPGQYAHLNYTGTKNNLLYENVLTTDIYDDSGLLPMPGLLTGFGTEGAEEISQTHYRFQNDDGSDVNHNTFAAAVDTNLTGASAAKIGEKFLIRLQINNQSGSPIVDKYQLQYGSPFIAGSCSIVTGWTDITSSSAISSSYANSGNSGDPVTSVQTAVNAGETFTPGVFIESTPGVTGSYETPKIRLPHNFYTEIVFAIHTGNSSAGSQYCLRAYNSSLTYDAYPLLEIVSSSNDTQHYSKAAPSSLGVGTTSLTHFLDSVDYTNVASADLATASVKAVTMKSIPNSPNILLSSSYSTSDNFGISLSSAGDVNGDGFTDIIVGATGNDSDGTNRGRAYIFHGSGTGISTLPTTTLKLPVSDYTSGDNFGSVSGAGDVNGDGYDDVIVGAKLNDKEGTDDGRAYVFHGGATGVSTTPESTLLLPASDNTTNTWFGFSVSRAGDVNADGYADVIVGAYGNDSDGGAGDRGRAYVFHGGSSGVSVVPTSILKMPYSDYSGLDTFSYSLSSAGDVNGDGYDDVIVGAYGNDTIGTDRGRSYIFHGGESGISTTIAATLQLPVSDWTDGGSFGVSNSSGDVNGDGYSDIVVGAHNNDSDGTTRGRAYIFHGTNSGISTTVASTLKLPVSDYTDADMFGLSVSAAGDMNGDGYSDVIVGATYNNSDGADRGRAYVFLGSTSGVSSAVASTLKLPLSDYSGADLFGRPVSFAGDINGDGYSDVLVGAYQNDNDGTDRGRAYVFSGGFNQLLLPASERSLSDYFGYSVSSAGDVNGDGYADVIVGARGNDLDGAADRGRAYVFRGTSSGVALDSPTILYLPSSESSASDNFGYSVSSAGDVNGDSYADVVVGAPYNDLDGAANRGRAYVFRGTSSGVALDSPTVLYLPSSERSANDYFGSSVSSAGDVNSDGYADVIVGAYANDLDGAANRGRAYVFRGTSSGVALDSPTVLYLPSSERSLTDYFGYSVSSAGDVHGDGYADVIVGAYGKDLDGAADRGRSYVFRGTSSGVALDSPTVLYLPSSERSANDYFGNSVSSAGDVNGDGYADVIVGAYGNDLEGANTGRAYLYLGSSSGLSTSSSVTYLNQLGDSGVYLGLSVSSAGDTNGDGYSDILISAHNALESRGAASSFFGGASTTGSIPQFLFAQKNDNNTDEITVSWTGSTSLTSNSQNASSNNRDYLKLKLQIYNENTDAWVTLGDPVVVNSMNKPITIGRSLTTSLSDYYDGSYWTHFRLYQETSPNNGSTYVGTTGFLRTDVLSVTYTSSSPSLNQLLRHGQWFLNQVRQKFTY